MAGTGVKEIQSSLESLELKTNVATQEDAHVVEDDVDETKRHLNVVFTGHVDAGKSTTGGQILFLSGQVDDRTIQKYEKEAKDKSRESCSNHQWAQCEDCSKWRKLPIDALLPSKWTCSDNKWDPERSSCEPAQEISMEELAELIPIKHAKKPKLRMESDAIDASDGLDTLANLAILGEGEALPSQPTTKHPRHRPGCSCIVCIQPPSGKGPKHKQTCTCNVCMTVRRRFRTLMLRREKKAATDTPRKKETGQSSEKVTQAVSVPPVASATATTSSPRKADGIADGPEDMAVDHKVTSSPVKNHIDLNIQPDRDDEQSPKSGAAGLLSRDNPS